MRALVTGGAGFIGSHLVDALLGRGDDVRVLDDLSSGLADNIASGVDVVKADVADEAAVREAVRDVEVVFHLAAQGGVLRSVERPLDTDRVNAHGTVTVLDAARSAGVRRVVYASSSSIYGDTTRHPTPESEPPRPRSPYAASKLAGEYYCRVFSVAGPLETVALRYFNVFGPRQRPDSRYAAVVPRFIDALRRGDQPVVHGDGQQSRDFTFVDDVVAANLAAAGAPAARSSGQVYNVAGGGRHSVLELLATLADIVGVTPDPEHTDPRPGDLRASYADLTAARRDLGYEPTVDWRDGLRRTTEWFAAR
jgi:UDP-glucose 4-epimerase